MGCRVCVSSSWHRMLLARSADVRCFLLPAWHGIASTVVHSNVSSSMAAPNPDLQPSQPFFLSGIIASSATRIK